MKLIPLIMLLVIVTTEASYFDDFKGAMSSVESAFGRLLNDVVSDVKSTVHCTILAMKQVLAVNGIIPDPLPSKECYQDESETNLNIETTKSNRSYFAKNAAQEIHASISKVNETLSHILDNTGHQRIEDLKRVLKNETDRLTEVSSLLRKELENVSHRMKKEFNNIESDATSVDSIWNNMKILYEVEKNDKNSSKEIGQVLNEALDVLHVDKIGAIQSDEEKINVIMNELVHESNSNVSNFTTHRLLSPLEGELSALQNNLGEKLLSEDSSTDIKDVAARSVTNVSGVASQVLTNVKDAASEILTNIKDVATDGFKENDKVTQVAEYITNKSTSTVRNTSQSEVTDIENDFPSLSTDVDDISSFNFGENNTEAAIKGLQKTMGDFKKSAESKALLNNFFTKQQGTDVFENPHLLDNFEK